MVTRRPLSSQARSATSSATSSERRAASAMPKAISARSRKAARLLPSIDHSSCMTTSASAASLRSVSLFLRQFSRSSWPFSELAQLAWGTGGVGQGAVGLGSSALASGALRLLDHDRRLLEGDHQGFWRLILEKCPNQSGPDRHRDPSLAPVVHLAGGVTPTSRAKAAWATPAWARRATNSAPESVRMNRSV